MTSMTRTTVGVTGGVDTHGQSHHAAVIDHLGRQLGDREFPTSPAGYGALGEWLQGHGELDRVGVEAPAPTVPGWLGISVRQGCSSSRSTARIDGRGGPTASRIRWTPIRLLGLRCPVLPRSCRSYATARSRRSGRFAWRDPVPSKARSQATNQIKSLIVTGPPQLREQLRHLPTLKMIAACARLRPGHQLGDTEHATKTALRRPARRHQQLSEEITEADQELHQLVHQAAPALLALPGVGPEVAGHIAHQRRRQL